MAPADHIPSSSTKLQPGSPQDPTPFGKYLRNEKINYKVREHSLAKVPLLLVVGKREAEEGTVAVRRLGSDEHQKMMSVDEAVAMIAREAVAPDLA